MPRPKLPPELKRKYLVQVMLNAAEAIEIDDRSRAEAKSRAELLRRSFFGSRSAKRGPRTKRRTS